MKKLLFITGEGLGNVIECIPCVRTIKEHGVTLDFWFAHGSFPLPKIIPYVNKWFTGGERPKDINNYSGVMATKWGQSLAKTLNLPLLNKVRQLTMNESEVSVYMKMADDLGIKNLFWHGNCMYTPTQEKYDIVISNGFNYKSDLDWSVKSYIYYSKVVSSLKKLGLTVCSVGAANEYVPGTTNKTNIGLLNTFGLIKNAKLVIANDSGMYHAANALETPNIVIFTATSIKKNYDKRFHKFASVITRTDLPCKPCQPSKAWIRTCKNWKCRDIGHHIIINEVKKILKIQR